MKQLVLGKAKARAAAMRYRHPGRDLRIIAVAGSYGKTTTALLLAELLEEAGLSIMVMTSEGTRLKKQPLKGSYSDGAQIFQRALARAKQAKVNFVILEVTEKLVANHVLSTVPLEMAVITSDGPIAQAVLSQPANYAVVPSGFDVEGLSVAPHQAISFGTDELAEAKIARTTLRRGGTEIDLVIDHQTKLELATYLVGKANVMNVAAAVAAAYVLAADITTLQEGVARVEGVAGNFERVPVAKPYQVFIDAATMPASIASVIESAHALKKRRLLVAIDKDAESDIYETARALTDRLVVVGGQDEGPGVESAATAEEALELVVRGAKKDDLVLLLGRHFTARDESGTSMAQRTIEGTSE